jgi:uncharacterized protein YqjF (DUF2071 family)
MRQNWHNLLFVHWEVPAEPIRRLLPPGLELDLYEGRAYVGLVPFTMTGVRPVGLPAVPGLSRFHETNVRTYVHVGGRDPGVWFFSLDAANPVAVVAARAWYHLAYHYARMSVEERAPGQGTTPEEFSYASERRWPGPRPAHALVRGGPRGEPAPAAAGSLEHFLVERYLLYAHVERRGLYRGQVHHSSYPLQGATLSALDESLLAAAGIERPDRAPIAHFARGVSVEVFPLVRLGSPPDAHR